jgi:hypothetical protein
MRAVTLYTNDPIDEPEAADALHRLEKEPPVNIAWFCSYL